MHVDPLAMQAHDKGEQEADTIHTITLSHQHYRICKRSRVNNDLVTELVLGQTHQEQLSPGDRPKTQVATSQGPHHVLIQSSIETVQGHTAHIRDEKVLQEGKLLQTLTIQNAQTGDSHTVKRTFLPYQSEK